MAEVAGSFILWRRQRRAGLGRCGVLCHSSRRGHRGLLVSGCSGCLQRGLIACALPNCRAAGSSDCTEVSRFYIRKVNFMQKTRLSFMVTFLSSPAFGSKVRE